MATQTSNETRKARETGRDEEQERIQDQQREGGGRGSRPQVTNMTAIAARGMGQIYDMQLAATRMLLQTQARAASAFGMPDYSNLFSVGDDRARRMFSTTTDQFLNVSRRATDTVSAIQHEMGRMIESNTVNLSETWRHGLEEFAAQAEEGLSQLQEMARQQAEEAARAAESLGEATREGLRQTGEEFRETMRQGAERGREITTEQGEAMRAEGERAASQARGEEHEAERGGKRTRAA